MYKFVYMYINKYIYICVYSMQFFRWIDETFVRVFLKKKIEYKYAHIWIYGNIFVYVCTSM